METPNINEYLEAFDYGEGNPERMIRLIQVVQNYNEQFHRSYPTKVTATRYIDWHDMKTKGGVMPRKHEDESAWSGGFADNH